MAVRPADLLYARGVCRTESAENRLEAVQRVVNGSAAASSTGGSPSGRDVLVICGCRTTSAWR
jgi:hypothetical protein